MTQNYPKRLIEVDLPIKRISAHARREKSIRHGHISTLHIWWARRPLAACRAVICAALWPDPADELCPAAFRDKVRAEMLGWTPHERQKLLSEDSRKRFEAARQKSALFEQPEQLRGALLDFIADFANWDNSTVKEYLETSRALTQAAHEALGGTPGTRPLVVDPFAGGGAIPIEASRIGTDTFASDLNPIAVLLNFVALELVPRYGKRLLDVVRTYGKSVQGRAWECLAELYPRNPDGSTTVAWLWGRTIRCEGPACGLTYPVVGQTWVSRNKEEDEEIQLHVVDTRVESTVVCVKPGTSKSIKTSKGSSVICPRCQFVMKSNVVHRQLTARNGGAADAQLLAVVCRSQDGRTKFGRSPVKFDDQMYKVLSKHARQIDTVRPRQPFPVWDSRAFVPGLYGVSEWGYMHTPRQILSLATFANSIKEICASLEKDEPEFGKAVRLLLGLCLGRLTDTSASTCRWVAGTAERGGSFIAAANGGEKHMRWLTDFAESNPFSGETGSWSNQLGWVVRVIENLIQGSLSPGRVLQTSATNHYLPDDSADLLATDPPYGSAVPYSDLADFFYVWLRRALDDAYPDLLGPELTPKREEAVVNLRTATDGRGEKSEQSYHEAMTNSLTRGREILRPSGLGVIVFADKRTSEWEAMLGAVLASGWTITASWPVHTERPGRTRSLNSAALSSSIHLVCRPRENLDGSMRTDEIGDWRDVLQELPRRIHEWMPRLAEEGVVGADAIFACLGPALEIFSRYSRVEKASGETVTLKEYLESVWAAVAKEALTIIFPDADAVGFEEDARLTAMWLWTLNAGNTNGDSTEKEEADDEAEGDTKKAKVTGFVLEYDAARKIAQGLGAHLEDLDTLVEVSGETARLLPVGERARTLFGKDEGKVAPQRKKREPQMNLFKVLEEVDDGETTFGETKVARLGETVLDRIHQSMILFAAGRGEALKRLLVEDGVGQDQRFWRLAQALSALYPSHTEEKRWVDGVLARKKGLGF